MGISSVLLRHSVPPPSQTEVWEGLKAPPREDRHNCPSLARGYHEVVGVDKIYKYIRRVFQPALSSQINIGVT